MQIPYKSFYRLVEKHFIRRSIKWIIEECGDNYRLAQEFALNSKTYKFLEVFSRTEEWDKIFAFFINPRNKSIYQIRINKSQTIRDLSKFSVENPSIHKQEFIDLIEAVFKDNNGTDPQVYYDEFYDWVDKFINSRRLINEKIGRNEECPCGSGKKYKYCHGNPSN